MKEHKKLYKAGKKWVVATIMTIAATTMMATQVGHADDGTQHQQLTNQNTQVQQSKIQTRIADVSTANNEAASSDAIQGVTSYQKDQINNEQHQVNQDIQNIGIAKDNLTKDQNSLTKAQQDPVVQEYNRLGDKVDQLKNQYNNSSQAQQAIQLANQIRTINPHFYINSVVLGTSKNTNLSNAFDANFTNLDSQYNKDGNYNSYTSYMDSLKDTNLAQYNQVLSLEEQIRQLLAQIDNLGHQFCQAKIDQMHYFNETGSDSTKNGFHVLDYQMYQQMVDSAQRRLNDAKNQYHSDLATLTMTLQEVQSDDFCYTIVQYVDDLSNVLAIQVFTGSQYRYYGQDLLKGGSIGDGSNLEYYSFRPQDYDGSEYDGLQLRKTNRQTIKEHVIFTDNMSTQDQLEAKASYLEENFNYLLNIYPDISKKAATGDLDAQKDKVALDNALQDSFNQLKFQYLGGKRHTLTIDFVDSKTGKQIAEKTISREAGSTITFERHQAGAGFVALPDGYDLDDNYAQYRYLQIPLSDQLVTINVLASGETPTSEVTYTVHYLYLDSQTHQVTTVSDQTYTGVPGAKVPVSAPAGYKLDPSDDSWQNLKFGNVDDSISFYVTKQGNTPSNPTTITDHTNDGHLDSYQLTPGKVYTYPQLQVKGWHVAGASVVQKYHWIILWDNTTGKEVQRVQMMYQDQSDEGYNAHPNTPNSLNSGFEMIFDLDPTLLTHTLRIVDRYSDDSIHGEGNNTDYWSPEMRFDQGNHGSLDQMQIINGKLHVAGWHATNKAVAEKGSQHIIILWDQSKGREIARSGNVQSGESSNRTDVANAYPTIYNALYSGFAVDFDLTPEIATDNIQVVSRWCGDDANKNTVDHWFSTRRLTTDTGNYASLDTLSSANGILNVGGWHASNRAIGMKHHFIILLNKDNGREVARTEVPNNQETRNDVAGAYPDVLDAGQSGFKAQFHINSAMSDIQNLQVVSRWTNDPAGNGQSVDYWFSPVSLRNDNQGNLDSWQFIHGDLQVSGWNATSASVMNSYHTLILYDNTDHSEVTRIHVKNLSRNDVKRAYPNIKGAEQSGFSGTFGVIQDDYPDPTHDYSLISRYSLSGDANEDYVDHWFHLGKFDDRASSIDRFDRNGSQIHVTGWMANGVQLGDQQNAYLILLQNGNEVGRYYVNGSVSRTNLNSFIYRPDVQKAYPHIFASEYSGFDHVFDIPQIANGGRFQLVLRFTDDPSGNGHSNDIWSRNYFL